MTQRILVIGTGLIGGSIAASMRASGHHVTGHDASNATMRQALELEVVDEVNGDLASASGLADIIFICVPVGHITDVISTIAAFAAPGTVVTDVGSTKGPIVAEAERLLEPGRHFVGGHPMAGTETEGIASARADLFEGALWILTPTSRTDPQAFRTINNVVAACGARSLALEPGEHDRLVALVSHLPYAIANCLMQLAGRRGDERVFRAAAGSFRDVTRTAGSNPLIWRDILTSNREAVLDQLDAFIASLSDFRLSVSRSDVAALETTITEARAARERFPAKGDRQPRKPVTIDIAVADRAGVLAEVTTTVGDLGINIEDLWMSHGPAGGAVRLVVDGDKAATATLAALSERGFRVKRLDA